MTHRRVYGSTRMYRERFECLELQESCYCPGNTIGCNVTPTQTNNQTAQQQHIWFHFQPENETDIDAKETINLLRLLYVFPVHNHQQRRRCKDASTVEHMQCFSLVQRVMCDDIGLDRLANTIHHV